MRNVKRGHGIAALVKLFAAEKGKSLRTAQHHAQKDTEEWRAFMAAHAQAAFHPGKKSDAASQLALATLFEIHAPPPPDESHPAESREEEMEREQYALWRTNVGAAKQCALNGDPVAAAGFARTAAEALTAYQKARKQRVQCDLEARRLVPAGEFEELFERFKLAAGVFSQIGPEIAAKANPDNPQLVIRAADEWHRTRGNETLRQLMAA